MLSLRKIYSNEMAQAYSVIATLVRHAAPVYQGNYLGLAH